MPGPGVAEEPVAPAGGLCGLEMGIAGHEEIDFVCGAFYGYSDQIAQQLFQRSQLIPQPQAEVGCDLIVTAAAGVEFAGYGADQFGEAALVGSMDVLVAGFSFELTGVPLFGNTLEACDNLIGFLLCQGVLCGPVRVRRPGCHGCRLARGADRT